MSLTGLGEAAAATLPLYTGASTLPNYNLAVPHDMDLADFDFDELFADLEQSTQEAAESLALVQATPTTNMFVSIERVIRDLVSQREAFTLENVWRSANAYGQGILTEGAARAVIALMDRPANEYALALRRPAPAMALTEAMAWKTAQLGMTAGLMALGNTLLGEGEFKKVQATLEKMDPLGQVATCLNMTNIQLEKIHHDMNAPAGLTGGARETYRDELKSIITIIGEWKVKISEVRDKEKAKAREKYLVALGVAEKTARALLAKLETYGMSWRDPRNSLAATLAGTVGATVLGGQALRRSGRRLRHEAGPEAAPDYEEAHLQARHAIDNYYAESRETRRGVPLEMLLANIWQKNGKVRIGDFLDFFYTHAKLTSRKDEKWYRQLNDRLLANIKANGGLLEQ